VTAQQIAAERGIIIADTKLEFGFSRTGGKLTLGDEVLTPDSSRFWFADTYREGVVQESLDKQFVRNWLTSSTSGWDRSTDVPPPALPAEVVEQTRARYIEAYERLTGTSF
jgi:phosphoribosylaminoimidazole-succinocarboxamide synthase